MTTYWAIGKTPDGELAKAPFDCKRDARQWVADHGLVATRILTSYTNLQRYDNLRDHMRVEAAQ